MLAIHIESPEMLLMIIESLKFPLLLNAMYFSIGACMGKEKSEIILTVTI